MHGVRDLVALRYIARSGRAMKTECVFCEDGVRRVRSWGDDYVFAGFCMVCKRGQALQRLDDDDALTPGQGFDTLNP